MTESVRWVGILGGTFDPIHRGHVLIAEAALSQVDEVFLVPAAQPPHKPRGPRVGFSERMAMCRIAVEGRRGLSVWDLEGHRDGPSYTLDTMDEAARLLAPRRPAFVMGADSLLDLPHWRDPETLVRRHRILVVPRPGWPMERAPGEWLAKVELIAVESVDASSSDARKGRWEMLDPRVADYIRRKELYMDDLGSSRDRRS